MTDSTLTPGRRKDLLKLPSLLSLAGILLVFSFLFSVCSGSEAAIPKRGDASQRPGSRENRTFFLTEEERRWLGDLPPLKLGVDPHWIPLEYLDDRGEYQGLSSSYVALIEKALSLDIRPVTFPSWKATLEAAKEGKVDMLTAAVPSPERKTFLYFSKPYASISTVVVGHAESPFAETFGDLSGSTLGIQHPSWAVGYLLRHYPGLSLRYYASTRDVLRGVTKGEVKYGFLNRAAFQYYRKMPTFSSVRSLFETPCITSPCVSLARACFAFRKDLEPLVPLINRYLDSLDPEVHEVLLEKWTNVSPPVPSRWNALLPCLGWLLGVLGLFLGGTLVWNRRLRREITKRQNTEDILARREEMLSLAARAGNLGVFELFLRDMSFQASPLLYSMLDLPSSEKHFEMLSEIFRERLHQEDAPRVREAYGNLLAGENDMFSEEFRYCNPYKGVQWLLGRGERNHTSRGELCISGYIQDITDQKLREEEIACFRNWLQVVMDSLDTVIFVKDLEGRFLHVNQSMVDITGLPKEAILGKTHREIHNEEISRFCTETDEKAMEEGVLQMEQHIIHGDGTEHTYFTAKRLLRDFQGNPAALLGEARDVSAMRQLQKDLEKAKTRAEEANEAKSTFLANMSHEIRTPLHVVINMAHLLKETPLSPRQQDYTQNIQRGGQLLLSTINNILDLSKIEARKMVLAPHLFEVEELLRNAVLFFSHQAERKGLALNLRINPRIPRVLKGDDIRLLQILTNLLGNALKFTPRGEIVLSATPPETGEAAGRLLVAFSVRDTGIGIAPEEQAKLFQAFHQANSSLTRKHQGTGLGLTICARLTELMGGTITLKSAPNKGSTFTVTLPLDIPSPEELEEYEKSSSSGKKELSDALKGKKILVADDNAMNRHLLQELLKKYDMEVTSASNGKEAVALGSTTAFDLILMDIQMPEMDGLTAARLLREEKEGPNSATPILAMTAHALSSDYEKSRSAGMNDHLTKPIDPQKLYQTLQDWLTEKSEEKEAIPGISTSRGLETTGGDREIYAEMLRIFREEFAETPEKAVRLYENRELQELELLAHSVKGTGANLGALELSLRADRLVQYLRGEAQSPRELEKRHEAFLRELRGVLSALEKAPLLR